MAQARKETLCSLLIAFSSTFSYTPVFPSSVLNLILTMLLNHLYTLLAVGATLSQAALLPRLPILQHGVCRENRPFDNPFDVPSCCSKKYGVHADCEQGIADSILISRTAPL